MKIYDKARKILENTINKIAFTGQLRTSIHVYNIAVSLDDMNPKSKIERALTALFDIVDGKKNSDIKIVKEYLKNATI